MRDYRTQPVASIPKTEGGRAGQNWSVVVPAYNEEQYLAETLASITAQTISGATIILVDNGSSDETASVMTVFARENSGCKTVILSDLRPGKINALETGITAVETEFVALCDADTIYPPTYLERAGAMLGDAETDTVAAFAFGVYSDAGPLGAWFTKTKGAIIAALLPNQGHTGGYGHAFKTAALRKAGGYSAKLWPYMVADHEVVNRIVKQGAIAYRSDHWCLTSSRRAGRGNVDWKLHERLLYNITPAATKDWFFYEYLRPRFEARKFFNANLRRRDWEPPEA